MSDTQQKPDRAQDVTAKNAGAVMQEVRGLVADWDDLSITDVTPMKLFKMQQFLVEAARGMGECAMFLLTIEQNRAKKEQEGE